MLCNHNWVTGYLTEEERYKNLGRQTCTNCGSVWIIDSGGNIVRKTTDDSAIDLRVGRRKHERGLLDPSISRQVRWQRKMKSQGRCVICGIKTNDYRVQCKKHRRKKEE